MRLEWRPEAEFKEFEPRLKFETQLKYGLFHLKSYSMFQDFTRRSIETGGFETRLKFIKFGLLFDIQRKFESLTNLGGTLRIQIEIKIVKFMNLIFVPFSFS